jgi:hypothetical protein
LGVVPGMTSLWLQRLSAWVSLVSPGPRDTKGPRVRVRVWLADLWAIFPQATPCPEVWGDWCQAAQTYVWQVVVLAVTHQVQGCDARG